MAAVVPSLIKTSPVAFTRTERPSEAVATFEKFEEFTRTFVALVVPASIVNCGLNDTEHEFEPAAAQVTSLAELPRAAFVFASIRLTVKLGPVDDAAAPENFSVTVPSNA